MRDYFAERVCQSYCTVLEAEQKEHIANAPAPSTTVTREIYMRFKHNLEEYGYRPGEGCPEPIPLYRRSAGEGWRSNIFKQHAPREPIGSRKPRKKKERIPAPERSTTLSATPLVPFPPRDSTRVVVVLLVRAPDTIHSRPLRSKGTSDHAHARGHQDADQAPS